MQDRGVPRKRNEISSLENLRFRPPRLEDAAKGSLGEAAYDKTPSFRSPFSDYRPFEGDIGEYPTPKYRKKYWQIPKYCVKNQ